MHAAAFLIYIVTDLFIIIIAHELGHWVVARACGYWVPIFCIGAGKRYNWSLGQAFGTEWRITPLPLSGHITAVDKQFAGTPIIEELERATGLKSPALREIPTWQHVCMKLAGVTFNFLMAPLAFYVAALLAGYGALAAMGEAVVWLKQALWDMLAIVLPFSNPHPLAYNPMFQHGPVLMLGMLGSLSLAMIPFNLLPVPPMDGYALLDHAVIKVTGRSLSDEENKWLLARLILAFVLSIVAVIVLNLAFAVYDLVHMLNSMHAG